MSQPKGRGRRYGGRAKGTPNKKSSEAIALANELGVDPLKILLWFAEGNWKALGYESPELETIADGGIVDKTERIPPALRQKSAKEALPYLRPTLKALDIDIKGQIESKKEILVTSYEQYIKLVGDSEGYDEAEDAEIIEPKLIENK